MQFGIARMSVGIVAAALVGSASAASPEVAAPLTIAHSWSIEHETLVRQFSVGLGVNLASHDDAAPPRPAKVALALQARAANAGKDEPCAPSR